MVSSVTDTTIPAAAAGIEGLNAARLTLRGLSKRYSADPSIPAAVESIDLDIEPGEFVTLLGPSGCGKTSTLRMIAGFETLTEGTIDLDGVDISGMPPNRRPMSMVFQSYALFPHLSVRDNVSYGLKLKKMSASRIAEDVDGILAIMNLSGLADRAPHQLSGGQQQRVALARALVMRPKVLLFDEPLSNLDAKLRVQMRHEIRLLQRRLGITSIFVTHDQDEAMTMSDRIVVMSKGCIEQVGAPSEVYRRPASMFVADFIGRANFLDAEVEAIHDDGSATAAVLGDSLRVPAHPDIAVGDTAQLLVRPESVRLSSGAAVRSERVTGDVGRVLNTVFYGSTVEYEIETDSGNLIASVSDPVASEVLELQSVAHVRVESDRAWLLPDRE
ncbi:MAG: ABC transporter ATP-binding protein [Microbacterium gubbeenense]|uniref:ABC transporter ATP-binding protein n=2 Tax=Microbacterium gubbeenense TaxID=159896 RepID=UPI003F998739